MIGAGRRQSRENPAVTAQMSRPRLSHEACAVAGVRVSEGPSAGDRLQQTFGRPQHSWVCGHTQSNALPRGAPRSPARRDSALDDLPATIRRHPSLPTLAVASARCGRSENATRPPQRDGVGERAEAMEKPSRRRRRPTSRRPGVVRPLSPTRSACAAARRAACSSTCSTRHGS